jgi:hypothetical protein
MTTTLNPRFRSGPWTGATTPAQAGDVDGVEIVERLATRDDEDGALVRLASGQLAVLGKTLAVGAPRLLKLYATRRAATTAAPGDRAWWTQVRHAVAA